ncbi:hypothetical protein EI94DRAFT_1750984 [Lactarius quietus]|nr:hypothetical protein EI94DRAFT_1750984 [Lactarius quietus]
MIIDVTPPAMICSIYEFQSPPLCVYKSPRFLPFFPHQLNSTTCLLTLVSFFCSPSCTLLPSLLPFLSTPGAFQTPSSRTALLSASRTGTTTLRTPGMDLRLIDVLPQFLPLVLPPRPHRPLESAIHLALAPRLLLVLLQPPPLPRRWVRLALHRSQCLDLLGRRDLLDLLAPVHLARPYLIRIPTLTHFPLMSTSANAKPSIHTNSTATRSLWTMRICTTNSLLMSIPTILMMTSIALARITTVFPMTTIPARIRMAISVIMTYTHSRTTMRSTAVSTMIFLAIIILALTSMDTTITKGHLVMGLKRTSVVTVIRNALTGLHARASVWEDQKSQRTTTNGRTRFRFPRRRQLTSRLLNSRHVQSLRYLMHPTQVPVSPACFPNLVAGATRLSPRASLDLWHVRMSLFRCQIP